ncbi:sensor histidine kinase [Extibacter sp. GGCC_0201]|uniref:sensor histidine kinase n=1 Tax=Extibacter sp. GGCC_0201 TaxID=2731209 RepID=UPI001AA1C4A8|nr:HAMP domain-containing sensor histidine kinase [Extibacter sp. GGCC_0201]MBO1719708.1 HAMP domain-containing histidine kinase [Extibacter sp. GGCC_0201]
MQIWKKNFLVTFTLFVIVVYTCLFAVVSISFRNDLGYLTERAIDSEQGIAYAMQSIQELDGGHMGTDVGYIAERYGKAGILLEVHFGDIVLADKIALEDIPEGRIGILTYGGMKHLYIHDEVLSGSRLLKITYLENIQSFYELQNRKLYGAAAAGILISSVIGIMLYATMKRIFRPVNQIAHELRTPLTGIQGYAQYMMMGNITEEDRFFAAQQIVSSARSMKDVVDKLLIMGNVKEGELSFVPIDIPDMLEEIRRAYAGIELDVSIRKINGEPTLVRCLLENMISNAVNAGGHVKVTADEEGLCVFNGASFRTREEAGLKPHGYGLAICQDIAGIHRWKLKYDISEKTGTAAKLIWGSTKRRLAPSAEMPYT